MTTDRKAYLKAYRQSEEYKQKNAARMREKYTTEEGREYENKKKRFIRHRYYQCRKSAEKRGLEFLLTVEEFKTALGNYRCSYCTKDISDDGGYLIDRSDNSKGYVVGNVVACCTECNRKKKDSMTGDEFKKQMQATIEKHGSIEAILKGCLCTEEEIFPRCAMHGSG